MEDRLVLVTGASGFIAGHIIQQLQLAGYRVRGTVRSIENQAKVGPLKTLVHEAKHPLELVEANLNSDKGWDQAVSGCWAVIHVASALPSLTEHQSEDYFVVPAVQGTLRVLQAAAREGVKRVIITGSFSSVHGDPAPIKTNKPYTEEDLTDLTFPGLEFYAKSKTLAESAAWDFVNSLPVDQMIDLTVLLPTLVIGPPLLRAHGSATSVEVISTILNRTYPGVAPLQMIICDVRDVAKAHLKALVTPESAGHRILLHSCSMWLSDLVKIIDKEFRPQGYSLYTNTLPYFVFWIASFFVTKMKEFGFLDKLGKEISVSNKKMVELLGIEPTDPKDTLLDMVYAMIDLGITYQAKNYKKRGPLKTI